MRSGPIDAAIARREEYAAPWGPPKEAMRIRIPEPAVPPDGGAFDPRSLDVAVSGGILMHHIKHLP
jgi:hypothetical protein